MNSAMITSALNGLYVDGQFINASELDERTWVCERCGERHLYDDFGGERSWEVDGEIWCEACVEEDAYYCQRCGSRHSIDNHVDVRSFDGIETWCGYCSDHFAVSCEVCGEVVDRNYTTEDDGVYICDGCIGTMELCANCGHFHPRNAMTRIRGGQYVCESCRDDECRHCRECGEWVLLADWNDEHEMCNGCAEPFYEEPEDSNTTARSDNAVVRPYHSRPFLHFFGERNAVNNTQYAGIGVELEVDVKSGERAEFLQRALNRIDRIAGDRVYFNRDGSLRSGFEIITMPHTLEAFNDIPWAEIMDACKDNGFSSHDAGTCGLHVHFSRLMFGEDTDTQDDNIAKLVQFFEFYWDDMVKASRREGNQLSWCGKKGFISKKRIKDHVKERYGGHYEAINNSNSATVEIRIMRGTLNITSFNACIDLLVNLVKNACRIDWGEVSEPDEMLKGIKVETARYLIDKDAFADTARRISNAAALGL